MIFFIYQYSRIGYGYYDNYLNNKNLYDSINQKIRLIGKSSSSFSAQTIYIISWINITPISTPNQVKRQFHIFNSFIFLSYIFSLDFILSNCYSNK